MSSQNAPKHLLCYAMFQKLVILSLYHQVRLLTCLPLMLNVSDVQNWITNASERLPGLLYFFLDNLVCEFSRPSPLDQLSFLMSPSLIWKLSALRFFPAHFNPKWSDLLYQLLSKERVQVKEDADVTHLIKCGTLVETTKDYGMLHGVVLSSHHWIREMRFTSFACCQVSADDALAA